MCLFRAARVFHPSTGEGWKTMDHETHALVTRMYSGTSKRVDAGNTEKKDAGVGFVVSRAENTRNLTLGMRVDPLEAERRDIAPVAGLSLQQGITPIGRDITLMAIVLLWQRIAIPSGVDADVPRIFDRYIDL